MLGVQNFTEGNKKIEKKNVVLPRLPGMRNTVQ